MYIKKEEITFLFREYRCDLFSDEETFLETTPSKIYEMLATIPILGIYDKEYETKDEAICTAFRLAVLKINQMKEFVMPSELSVFNVVTRYSFDTKEVIESNLDFRVRGCISVDFQVNAKRK